MTNEVWRPVVGFESWYEVSSRGRVRRDGGRVLRPATNSWGYQYVALSRLGVSGTRNVHALVAAAFLGPKPPGKVIGFLNGDRADPRAENLRYITSSEVMHTQYRLGRKRAGHYHPPARLDAKTVQTIYEQKGKVPQRRLAVQFGISPTLVSRIHAGPRSAKSRA